MSKNLSELSGRKGLTNNLFEAIGKLAEKDGSPGKEDLEKLAQEFLVGSANTFGTSTFYDFTKPENRDKKVYLCNGTACLCARTQDKIKEKLRSHFKETEIGHMTCLGRCHENSAFHYNGKNYSGKSIDTFNLSDNEVDEHPSDNYIVGHNSQAILTKPIHDFENYYSGLNNLFQSDPDNILTDIIESNLRGRGGAGFPIGLKLKFARQEKSEVKFIICNADEGDPGAYSDRYLLEQRPDSVLYGMLVAGFLTGAKHGIIYIRAEYPEAIEITQNAIDKLRNKGGIGENVFSSNVDFDIKIIKAQGAYICGEETALINSIEGQRPEVRVRPPFPAQSGLFNKPTVVNNVETLAALHFIIVNGSSAYKKLGTEKSTGTKLMCLDGYFNQPGLYEVEMGTPLTEVIYDLGGGFREPVKAIQIGGPLGGLIPVWKIADLTVDFESFSENGFLLGHASVVSIPEKFPIIEFIGHLFDFASYESCGKCFPCRLGTKRGQEMTRKAMDTDYKLNKKLLEDLLLTLEQTSLCAHGGGIPLPIKNALHYFESELEEYFE